MNRLGQIKLPPLSAAVNVASQLKNQIIPSRGQQEEGRERVHFAQLNQNHTSHGGTDEHHEMSNMRTSTNPFLSMNQEGMPAEDSFNEGGGYQTVTGPSRMSSVDFSEGSDFVEGKCDIKINEYQAAWNVTNAIQVNISFIVNYRLLNCSESAVIHFLDFINYWHVNNSINTFYLRYIIRF